MLDLNLSSFGLDSALITIKPIVGGHINKTFKLNYLNQSYVAQVINSNVFQSVENVMDNISIVCKHLVDRGVYTLEYLRTNEGLNYSINSLGQYVRVCKYVENSISFEFSNDLTYIYNAGMGFGQFISNVSDIPLDSIKDTIPNFHNTNMYLERLFNMADVSKYQDRVIRSEKLLNDIYHLKDYANVTQSMTKRVTHNDIRFNNILFNRLDKSVLCVIDLDTIMKGYIPYDFADGIRSICRNMDNTLSLEKFHAYTKGFLSYPIGVQDKSILIDSIVAVSLELSTRYLYEYLSNGNYFNLSSCNDNLVKAIGYIDFLKDVLNKRDTLKSLL